MNAASLLNAAVQLHQQGRFNEAETAYRKTLGADPRNADALALMGCVLSELKKHEEALAAIEQALAIDNSAPLFYLHYGNALDKAGHKAKAEGAFLKATQLAPLWPDAWYNLANVQREARKSAAAREGYQKVLALSPQHALSHNNLALLFLQEQDFAKARQHAETAHKAEPGNLQILFTLSDVLFESNDLPAAFAVAQCIGEIILGTPAGDVAAILTSSFKLKKIDEQLSNCILTLAASYLLQGRLEPASALLRFLLSHEPDAEEALSMMGSIALARNRLEESDDCYAQAFMLDPSFTEAPWNRSIVLLTLGKMREGCRRYRWRWSALEKFRRMALKAPMWDGSDLKGKTILVHEEQGFGDSLQMLRFLPQLKARGARVWYYARPALYKLIENWQGADRVIEWKDFGNSKTVPEGVDLVCGNMDLPGLLDINLSTLPADAPYLPNPKKGQPEFKLEGDGLKVGLVWSGNPQHKRDHERSIPLSSLKPLMGIKGAHYYSLQFKAKESDLKLMNEWGVTDLSPKIRDLADTAAFLDQLDLLITVDSAPTHLAGALGRKVWTLVTLNPDWRWLLEREDSPWYPSLRLFRQREAGNWADVIAAVEMGIKSEVEKRAR